MDAAYVSAFFGLAGAVIGGLTSFSNAWLTQHMQTRDKRFNDDRVKREELYGGFITEASRLFGDALSRQRDDIGELVQLYALVARMRLMASRPVVDAAEAIVAKIVDAYLEPNRTLHDIKKIRADGSMNVHAAFSEACRRELGRA